MYPAPVSPSRNTVAEPPMWIQVYPANTPSLAQPQHPMHALPPTPTNILPQPVQLPVYTNPKRVQSAPKQDNKFALKTDDGRMREEWKLGLLTVALFSWILGLGYILFSYLAF